MRNNLLLKTLITAALLILAIPIGASAQVYRDRSYNRYDNRDQYDQVNRRQVQDAVQRLDNSAARLEGDLNVNRGRRVLGMFWLSTRDDRATAEIRDFRQAVRQLRYAPNNGLAGSTDEEAMV